MASKNLHEGHRDRLKSQFLENGLDGFQEHQILELLLFYSIPQKDTNDLAHELLNTFGSLDGVLDASYEDLITVKGIKHHSATLITMMPQLFRRYNISKTDKINIFTPDTATAYLFDKYKEYLRSKLIAYTDEIFIVLCLDNSNAIKNCCLLSKGSATEVNVNPREVVEVAIRNKATNIIIAHNHPGGFAYPSDPDVNFTKQLADILESIKINLRDHIIISDKRMFSMASHRDFEKIFKANFIDLDPEMLKN